MGNVLTRLLRATSRWATLGLFALRFRAMQVMQYCTAKLADEPTCVDDIEALARRSLLRDVYGLFACGYKQVLKENRIAYSRYQIRPRYVRDTSDFNMKMQLLGEAIDFPIGIAPTGGKRLLHWEGEIATARVCSKMNTCMILSSFTTTSMEDVAKTNKNGLLWLHILLTLPDDMIKEHVIEAEKLGYKALVLTVDQPDITVLRDNLYLFDMKQTTFPMMKIPPNVSVVKHVTSNCFSFPITWEKIEWIQTLTSLPIVIKGILTAEDAIEAVKHNIHAIAVSNHGGRQLGCVPATIDVLEEIVNAVGDKVEVYVDGGIRNGTDVFKALALGAKAVFVGRPILWGLAYKGSDGVELALSILKEELKVTMRLAGCAQLSDISKDMIMHQHHH